MTALIFALVAYLGWGVGDIFGTIAARKLDAYSTVFWRVLLALLVFSLYIPFAYGQMANLTWHTLLINIAVCIAGIIGLIAFYEGLRIGNASVVGTISAAFIAVTVIMSVLFLGEKITLYQLLAIVVIFAGVILTGLDFKELRENKSPAMNKSIWLAIVAMIFWGIYYTFIKIPVREVGWFFPELITLLLAIPIALFMMKFKKTKLIIPDKTTWVPVLGNSLLLSISDFAYNYAVSKGMVAIVAPIAGSYPTLFVLLASLIFKDPITTQQKIGIAVTLIGIVSISFLLV